MHNPNIQINKVTIADINELQALSKATFFETFAPVNTVENMEDYSNTAFSSEQLMKEIDDTNSEFYFIKLNNETAGYIKINTGKSQTELREDNGLEIERIYVLQAFQGRQMGHLLLHKAIAVANANHKNYIWLGVWEKNKKAILFYEKHGFKAFGKHTFTLGDDVQTDLMMKLDL